MERSTQAWTVEVLLSERDGATHAEARLLSGLRAPLSVFVPLLTIHLIIAVTALGVAVASWLIARKGIVPTAMGIDLKPEVRVRHRRVSKYYPYLWASTLATGLLLYYVVYVVY